MIEDGVGFESYAVRRFRAVSILRMPDLSPVRDVLTDLSPQCHGQRLNAPADAQDGKLPVVSQLRDEQFRQIALSIDAPQTSRRFLARIERVEISPSTEQQAVNTVQRVDNRLHIAQRRDDDRHSPSLPDRLVVALAQLAVLFTVIARNANDRPACSLRKRLIGRRSKLRLPVEAVCHHLIRQRLPVSRA